jgi:uncharacterized membrane protein
MNSAHFHLVVNHLPIIFPIAGLIVLSVGMGYRNELVKRISYFLFVISAVTAFISMNSGEAAEEMVEELSGVSHHLIHEHEEKAELMAIMSYLLGVVSSVAFWASFKGKTFSNLLSYAVAVMAVVTVFMGKQTGTSGGEIRHTEIRSTSSGKMDLHEDEED